MKLFSREATAPQEKGSALREMLVWFELRHGRERLLRVLERMPAAHRSHFDPRAEALGLLPSTWYPSEMVIAFSNALDQELSPPEREEMIVVGSRHAVQSALRGVYRYLLQQFSSPERYAKHAQFLWDVLHTTGERRVEVYSDKRATLHLASWAAHTPLLCRVANASVCALFEVLGCSSIRITQEVCRAHEGRPCGAELRWS